MTTIRVVVTSLIRTGLSLPSGSRSRCRAARNPIPRSSSASSASSQSSTPRRTAGPGCRTRETRHPPARSTPRARNRSRVDVRSSRGEASDQTIPVTRLAGIRGIDGQAAEPEHARAHVVHIHETAAPAHHASKLFGHERAGDFGHMLEGHAGGIERELVDRAEPGDVLVEHHLDEPGEELGRDHPARRLPAASRSDLFRSRSVRNQGSDPGPFGVLASAADATRGQCIITAIQSHCMAIGISVGALAWLLPNVIRHFNHLLQGFVISSSSSQPTRARATYVGTRWPH